MALPNLVPNRCRVKHAQLPPPLWNMPADLPNTEWATNQTILAEHHQK
jgi:hypothetical protein